jgi:hypothetical protein
MIANAAITTIDRRADGYYYEDVGYDRGEVEALKKAIADLKLRYSGQAQTLIRLLVLMDAIAAYHDGYQADETDSPELVKRFKQRQAALDAAVKAVMVFDVERNKPHTKLTTE